MIVNPTIRRMIRGRIACIRNLQATRQYRQVRPYREAVRVLFAARHMPDAKLAALSA